MPENRLVFPQMSVRENLLAGAYQRRDKAEIAADIERMYARFPRLRERREQLAGTLSGGEQQMLAVARALMSRPRLLLMDEPSLGLAPLVVAEIFRIVAELNRDGTTIFLVEQNAHMALQVAHQFYLMEQGRVTFTRHARAARRGRGDPARLSRHPPRGGMSSYRWRRAYSVDAARRRRRTLQLTARRLPDMEAATRAPSQGPRSLYWASFPPDASGSSAERPRCARPPGLAGADDRVDTMIDFVQNTIDGVMIGSSYGLLALGFTLIFGVMRRLNLSYGPSIMVGAYLGTLVYVQLAAGPLAVVAVTVLGAVARRPLCRAAVLRPDGGRRRHRLDGVELRHLDAARAGGDPACCRATPIRSRRSRPAIR